MIDNVFIPKKFWKDGFLRVITTEKVGNLSMATKGVFGGPSGPSREGPGVGHKIVSDTKQMTKERKKEKR